MKESIRQRLEKMTDRFEEVGRLLATTEIAVGFAPIPRFVDGIRTPDAAGREFPGLP
jgi:hypothetical protein